MTNMIKLATFFRRLFCWHDWREDDPFTFGETCHKCGKKQHSAFIAGRIPKPPRRGSGYVRPLNGTPPAPIMNAPRFDHVQQNTPLDRIVRAFENAENDRTPLDTVQRTGDIRIDMDGVTRIFNGEVWLPTSDVPVDSIGAAGENIRRRYRDLRNVNGDVVARAYYSDDSQRTVIAPPAGLYSSGIISTIAASVEPTGLTEEQYRRFRDAFLQPSTTQDAPPHTPVEPAKPLRSRIRLDE